MVVKVQDECKLSQTWKGKQIGIRKRILKGNKYYWYSYAIQKVNDIYIVYEHEIAEDNICMEIDEYENIYQYYNLKDLKSTQLNMILISMT